MKNHFCNQFVKSDCVPLCINVAIKLITGHIQQTVIAEMAKIIAIGLSVAGFTILKAKILASFSQSDRFQYKSNSCHNWKFSKG